MPPIPVEQLPPYPVSNPVVHGEGRAEEQHGEGEQPLLLLEDEVAALTRLSSITRWRLERRGLFPRRLKIGLRRVAWLRAEIFNWLEARAAARPRKEGSEAA